MWLVGSDGGTVWWNSVTVMVEQCGETVEQCCGTLEQLWWNSGTVMVEQSGGTVKMAW